MAKFKYRMQNVLNIKLKLEDQAKMAYGESNARLNEQLAILQRINDRKLAYELEGVKLRENAINVVKLRENHAAMENLQDQVRAQEENVRVARLEVERTREALQLAMQERKTQEKLYDNAFEEFKKEEIAKEGKEVDELTSYVYGQRQLENA